LFRGNAASKGLLIVRVVYRKIRRKKVFPNRGGGGFRGSCTRTLPGAEGRNPPATRAQGVQKGSLFQGGGTRCRSAGERTRAIAGGSEKGSICSREVALLFSKKTRPEKASPRILAEVLTQKKEELVVQIEREVGIRGDSLDHYAARVRGILGRSGSAHLLGRALSY